MKNVNMKECVAAIATALAPAGLGVVRLSGKDAIKIASKFFKSKKDVEKLKGYEATYGKILEDDFVLDDGVLLVFRAPNSYTGEDVVEISCHGGLLILERLLKLCFKNGAKPAKRGEFTKRAFLNGKLTLTQAESVMEIVAADSVGLLKAFNGVKNGVLHKKTKKVLKKLVEQQGHILVYLDYPQEDIEEVSISRFKKEVEDQKKELEKTLNCCGFETILKNGVNVSIVGNPNVGKSTIMNAICGEEKSIVTDIVGTTRDVLKHSVEISGVNFVFADTAGFRKTDDAVEKIGIKRALDSLKQADIVLFVVDDRTKKEDLKVLKNNDNCKKILIYNKIDLNYKEQDFGGFDFTVKMTNKDINTINDLKDALLKVTKIEELGEKDSLLILNERQKNAMKKAIKNLEKILELAKDDVLLDAVSAELEEAIENLLELTGEKVSELVLEEIFSKFCVGK